MAITTKKHSIVLCITATIIAVLIWTSHYDKDVVIPPFQETIPKNFSSRHVPKLPAAAPPTTHRHTVHIRDIFDPSKVPKAPIGPDNITDKERYFIYRCDESTMSVCGGWADRIKGAMYSYMVANLTGRSFKMEILFGSCDTQRFIVPNQVNWSLPNSFHRIVKPGPNISQLSMIDNMSFITRLDHDFLALPDMKSKYLYFKVNREPLKFLPKLTHYQSQLGWMKNLEYPEIFNFIYRRLFKPSTYLLSKVNSFLKEHLQPNCKLVCIHLRMGLNPSIQDVGQNIYTKEEHLPIAWEFLYNVTHGDNSRIFLMSDSAQTINKAKGLNFSNKFFFSSGKIIHIDHAKDIPGHEKCEGYETIIFEQLVLMHCDVLVITRNSGISRLAAFIRGTDDNLFCFYRTGELIPCKRTDLY